MSISLIRVEAPGEKWEDGRVEPEITPTLPAVLGRGSLLRCGDKKVSRRHAYLDWDDDGVMLTSVHQTPTFALSKGVVKELTEGDTLSLTHGDKFGLVKDKFWYMINLPKSCQGEEENGTKKCNKEVSGNEVEPDVAESLTTEPVRKEIVNDISPTKIKNDIKIGNGQTTSSHTDIKDESFNNDTSANIGSSNSGEDHMPTKVKAGKVDGTPETISNQELQMAVSNKARALPSWLKGTEPKKPQTGKESQARISHGGSRKSSSVKLKASKNVNISEKTSAVSPKNDVRSTKNSLEGKDENFAGNDIPKQQDVQKAKATPTKNNKSPVKRTPVKPKGSPAKKKGSPLKNSTKGLHTMSDEDSEDDSESELVKPQTKTPERDGGRTTPNHHPVAKHDMSDESAASSGEEEKNSSSKPSPTAATSNARVSVSPAPKKRPKKKPRAPCQYGDKCYRKNPQHLADYSHVGDSDYKEESSDPEGSDDDRPQCEYGVDCYRKNPQHNRDYRHDRLPQPQRRAKRKARGQKQRDGDDSADDYDYDDPFLNDGSSDDYAPTDSGSDSDFQMEEEEDTKRMLKEGRKFVKNRK